MEIQGELERLEGKAKEQGELKDASIAIVAWKAMFPGLTHVKKDSGSEPIGLDEGEDSDSAP